MSATFGADFHELVGTTALVLRRGLPVAILGALIVAVVGAALMGLAALPLEEAERSYGCRALAVALLVVIGPVASALLIAVPLAAFTVALRESPGLGAVLARALRSAVEIAVVLLVGGGCVVLVVAAGGHLIGLGLAAFSSSARVSALVLLAGASVLLLGPYVLAASMLLPATALIAVPRTEPGRLSAVVPRWKLALVVGWTPVVPAVALGGPFALPLFGAPGAFQTAVLVVGLVATVFFTLAVSVAAFAVARASVAAEGSP